MKFPVMGIKESAKGKESGTIRNTSLFFQRLKSIINHQAMAEFCCLKYYLQS